MKKINIKALSTDIKKQAGELAQTGFRQVFEHIDQLKIKKGVDALGIDKFINQCAWLAAGSGAMAGSGGIITMLAGLPLDVANLITQQFRVTMAVMYHQRGDYHFTFDEFMNFVATSLKVEAGVAISKTMMEGVAEKLLLLVGSRAAERLVPVVGAAIGGTANYLFIKRMAKSVKEMNGKYMVQRPNNQYGDSNDKLF